MEAGIGKTDEFFIISSFDFGKNLQQYLEESKAGLQDNFRSCIAVTFFLGI